MGIELKASEMYIMCSLHLHVKVFMSKVVVKAVIVGAFFDFAFSNILQIPLIMFITSIVAQPYMNAEQVQAAVQKAMANDNTFYLTSVVLVMGCSVLAGYVAATIARRNEILNGALASFFSVGLGIFSMVHGTDQTAVWEHVLFLIMGPVLAGLGGFIRKIQIKIFTKKILPLC